MANACVERLDDTFGAILVEEAEADAQADDAQDDDGVRPLSDHERSDRRRGEQNQQWVSQLPPEDRDRRCTVAADGIRPVIAEPSTSLACGETGVRASKPDDYVGGIGASSVDEPSTIAFCRLDYHVAN